MSRMRRKRRSTVGDIILALVILSILIWFFFPQAKETVTDFVRNVTSRWSPSSVTVEHLPDGQAKQELGGLRVRSVEDSVNVPNYDREKFGERWADTDANGCDTRNDVLARDLARPVFKEGTNGCVVLSGTLAEPYTGTTMEFRKGKDTSADIQIDHVVALADAWKSGAWQWSATEREDFANDFDNLLAVAGTANQEKLAASADMWLPPNRAFQCSYVERQIHVKSTWGLSVTEAERHAMIRVLVNCG